MIPKTLHFIWVGDEAKRPDNCIRTWAEHNPAWQIKVWGNASLVDHEWFNARHMREMSKRELNGVADMMRWEILYNEGGFVVDADSVCVRPLDDSLLDCEAFACWESEIARPGLIAAGYFACAAANRFVGQIVTDIYNEPTVVNDMAWKTVGPMRLTESYRRYAYHGLSILPSHLFIPEHFTGVRYEGPGPVYAHQEWASTKRSYDTLHTRQFALDGRNPAAAAVAAAPVVATAPAPACGAASAASPTGRTRSVLEDRHAPYFVQRVQVGRELAGRSRLDVFTQICAGRRVLHMGCADWPITDPGTSLHLALEPHCARLDGFDIHAEALAGLAPHTKGRLYSRLQDVTDEYDLVLVPEVMEHVPDVGGFLAELHALKAPNLVITVPDAYQCHKRHFDYVQSTDTFVEVVHPDHNCWYTPYTLANVIAKYTPWTLDGLWFFNNISLLAMLSKPKPN
jgi:mannosyltransferase OCH1-like enzyme